MKNIILRFAMLLVTGCAFALSNGQAIAGPFGLRMGATKEELGRIATLKQIDVDMYSATNLPNANPEFPEYLLFIGSSTGLCKVLASTDTKKTSIYGDQVRSDFAQWEAALTEKYGTPKKYDFLRQGSIWKDPGDWSMALYKEERNLAAFWTNASAVDSDIQTVQLDATAISRDKYYLSIKYEFTNSKECSRAAQTRKKANL